MHGQIPQTFTEKIRAERLCGKRCTSRLYPKPGPPVALPPCSLIGNFVSASPSGRSTMAIARNAARAKSARSASSSSVCAKKRKSIKSIVS